LQTLLVTNDDGIDSPALPALVHSLTTLEDVEVFVVAPEHEWSAGGHAITIRHPVYADALDDDRFGVGAWSVSGSPADCVKLAVYSLLPRRPDMVVSGINLGYNLATDVLYSGTVAAAIESVLAGVPALAISSGRVDGTSGDYAFPARVAATMTEIATHIPQNPWLLNINVPDRPRSELAGIEFTELGPCPYEDKVLVGEDHAGRRCYHLAVDPSREVAEEGTDLAAVRAGKISITPLEVLRITQSHLLKWLSPFEESLHRRLLEEGES